MSVFVECKYCGNILPLRVIECGNCDNDLIFEELNIHAELQKGMVSETGISLMHNPSDENYIDAVSEMISKLKAENDENVLSKHNQEKAIGYQNQKASSKVQIALNELTGIANRYALRGEWSWQNTGGVGYLQGILAILIGGSDAADKFDECAREINKLLIECSIDNQWGWKNLSEPPHNLKVDISAYVDDEAMSAEIDSILGR